MKKKILLSLMCAVTGMVSFAQDFTVTGTVTDQNSLPVPNHGIYIYGDSAIFNYFNIVTTDASGNYSHIIPNGAQVGPNVTFTIGAADYCNPNGGGWQSYTLSNNQGTTTSGVVDFQICDSLAYQNNCSASFYGYDSLNTGDYYFVNMSNGNGLTYAWDFGDGSTSNLQNPTHTFAAGTYTVCLYVTDGQCSNSYCQTITVGGQSCNAAYYSYVDTTNNSIFVIDLSNTNNPGSGMTYLWDFGDGNTSTSQFAIHTYANVGIYNVCLTVATALCTSTYCDSIGITQFMADESRSGFTLNVIAPATLGMEEELNTISAINVFPNPANENVNIEYNAVNSGNHSISLVDVTGKLVYNENFSAQKGNNRKQINLNGVDAGIYLVTIADENGKQNHIRLIKN